MDEGVDEARLTATGALALLCRCLGTLPFIPAPRRGTPASYTVASLPSSRIWTDIDGVWRMVCVCVCVLVSGGMPGGISHVCVCRLLFVPSMKRTKRAEQEADVECVREKKEKETQQWTVKSVNDVVHPEWCSQE